MLPIYVASTSTSHFTWNGIGDSRESAIAALLDAWQLHARESGADPAWLGPDDVNVMAGTFGTGFRDGQPMTGPQPTDNGRDGQR